MPPANNRGLLVGRVAATDPAEGQVAITLAQDVNLGDSLEIWVSRGGRVGITLECMWVDGRMVDSATAGQSVVIPMRDTACPGDRVFRIGDAKLQARAWAPLTEGPGLLLSFYAQAHIRIGQPIVLELTDDGGHTVTVRGEVPGQPARNRPLDQDTVREHLGRTGGSDWRAAEIVVDLTPGTMLPLSELNRIRRVGLAALEDARLASFEPWRCPVTDAVDSPDRKPCAQARQTSSPLLSATVGAPEEARAAMTAGADRLYLASWLHLWPDDELLRLLNMAMDRQVELVFALPRVVPEREIEYWSQEMDRVRGLGIQGFRLGDLGLCETAGVRSRIYFDFSLNVMNPWSLRLLAAKAERVTLSPEMTLTQVRQVSAARPGARSAGPWKVGDDALRPLSPRRRHRPEATHGPGLPAPLQSGRICVT